MQEIGVTVYTLVYNHEKYIHRCLESLVSQKTNFKYRVIVHDDASTDGSKSIIKKFAEKYPDILCPIYQTENQFFKTPIVTTFIAPMVHSKYVALCEGDDYWIDEYKLQRQYDAMEENPECGACLHRTLEVSENEQSTGIIHPEQFYGTGVITADQLFATFTPRMYHTSSFFLRESLWHEYIKTPPSYKKKCDIGDAPILLYFGSRYKVYLIDEVMSCYRRGAEYSWSSGQFTDKNKMINHHDSMICTYKLFDEETQNKFHGFVVKRISMHLFAKCAMLGDFSDYLGQANAEYLRELPFLKRMMVYLGVVNPGIVKKMYYRHLKNKKKTEHRKWYDART